MERSDRAGRGRVAWRTGRSVGRTIYIQGGPDPARGDRLAGLMDTPELAQLVADAVNEKLARDSGPPEA